MLAHLPPEAPADGALTLARRRPEDAPGAPLARPAPAAPPVVFGAAPPGAVFVAAYLGRMRSASGRAAQLTKLHLATRVLSGGRLAHPADLDWPALQPGAINAMMAALAAPDARGPGLAYAARTINAVRSAVRGVLREAWRAGALPADRLSKLVDDVRLEPIPDDPTGRAVPPAELAALLAVAGADRNARRGARDRALLAVAFGAGLRVSEAVALDWADFTPTGGPLGGAALTVRRGKGRRSRAVPLAPGPAADILRWHALTPKGAPDDPLLIGVRGFNPKPGARMGPETVRQALRRLTAAAGVEPVKPHDARRSYVSSLLAAGADLSTVAALAGHRQTTTTARYDRRPEAARAAAANLLLWPAAPPEDARPPLAASGP